MNSLTKCTDSAAECDTAVPSFNALDNDVWDFSRFIFDNDDDDVLVVFVFVVVVDVVDVVDVVRSRSSAGFDERMLLRRLP